MNILKTLLIVTLFCAPAAAEDMDMASPHMININYDQIQWQTADLPNGDSFELSILNNNEATGQNSMLIRADAGINIPLHWHTANESIVIIEGVLNLESEGHTAALSKAGFHYLPSKVIHRAWTNEDEGVLLFISADAPWDINFVEQ